MDTLLNIRAFLAVANAGTLTGAARVLGVAPSVVSKRISRLEDEMGLPLFVRTTRKVEITPAGSQVLPRYRVLVQEIDETLRGARDRLSLIEGSLRIKCPTTVALAYFGRFFADFQQRHPDVSIDLVLLDRSINPSDEGFDLALGAQPVSYNDVRDIILCPYPRICCASPAYLAENGTPEHPRDLVRHACLSLHATGNHWLFASDRGDVGVNVRSHFTVNDSGMAVDAACRGRGITVVGEYVARQAIAEERLVEVLPTFPVKMLWLKALVPTKKLNHPVVKLMMEELVEFTQHSTPWDRQSPAISWARDD